MADLTEASAAKQINDEHELAIRHAVDAVGHAICCGELLIARKLRMGETRGPLAKGITRETFKGWVKNHCCFSYPEAARYMQAARNKDKILAAAPESLRKALLVGQVLHKARQTPPLPKGRYNIIVADPPWQYEFSETNARAVESKYPTMSAEELAALDIGGKAADECVLFLWATAPKLEEALAAADAWGFEYKTHAIWDKQIIGMGYWFRGQHELLLCLTKGTPAVPEPATRPSSIFSERRSKHSVKPEVSYRLIERMFPSAKKLELFARVKRPGWAVWP